MLTIPIIDVAFRYPDRLWFAIPIVIVLGILIVTAFRSMARLYRDDPILRLHGKGSESVRRGIHYGRWVSHSLLVILLTIVWAEPLNLKTSKESVWGGVRVAFLLDVSLSMKYAHDVAPFPDRLIAAKSVLADFADVTLRDPELKGKYHLAIIPFAGEATTYLGFSKSREEFVEAIDAVDETTVGAPGTNMHNALLEYERMWKSYPLKDDDTVDLVVMVTDGGKGEGNRKDIPHMKGVLSRLPNSVSVFTVGVGSVQKTTRLDGKIDRQTIAVELSSLDVDGRLLRYLLEDPNDPSSKRLTSELDEETLQLIAGERGKYFYYEGKTELLTALKEVIVTKRKLVGVVEHVSHSSISMVFLIPAFFIAFFLFGYAQRVSAICIALVRRPGAL